MSNTTGKRGFIPAQPAAAISALDFAATAETFALAVALDGTGKTEDDTARIADAIALAADRVLSTPAMTPEQIAIKVEAYGWLTNVSPRLSDPDAQHRIADGGDDAAKGLLAIYLDLTANRAERVYQPAPELNDLMKAATEAYQAFEQDCDTLSDDVLAAEQGRTLTAKDAEAYRRLSDAMNAAFNAVRAYPAKTASEALAKLTFCEVLMGDDGADTQANLNAVGADLARWTGAGIDTPPAGESPWQAVLARWQDYQRETERLERLAGEDENPDFTPEHRAEYEASRAALLDTTPTDWGGVGIKAMLLRGFGSDDVWEDDWTPNPEAPGWEGHWATLLAVCAALGNTPPAEAEPLDVLKAVGAAEAMARDALKDPNGYAAYGCNTEAVASMVQIITTVQTDARHLAGSQTRTDFLAGHAINAVWFDQLPADDSDKGSEA